jgi:hypothetical protein
MYRSFISVKSGLRRLVPMLALALLGVGTPPPPPTPPAPPPPTVDDDARAEFAPTQTNSTLQIYADWVTDYSATSSSNLTNTKPDAEGLINALKNCANSQNRPSKTTVYGNSMAWEKTWKFGPYGGIEADWVDQHDLAYFSGHGTKDSIVFGTLKDDKQLHYSEAGYWGDGDLEWVAFSACDTMSDYAPLSRWHHAMLGLHLMLGFKTLTSDVDYGKTFGAKLCAGQSLTQAWFGAADARLPTWQVPRILAEEQYHFDDTLQSRGGADPHDSTYHTRSYTRNTAASLMASVAQPSAALDAMPVLPTPQLDPAVSQAQLEKLGALFGIDVQRGFLQLAASPQENQQFVSGDGSFTYDLASGKFVYHNLQRLWVAPDQGPVASRAMVTLAQADALSIADQYLRTNGLMTADARAAEVAVEQIENWREAQGSQGQDKLLSVDTVGYKVSYSRILQAPVGNAQLGAQAVQDFSVVGPGPKLVVYVDAQVPAGLTQAQQAQSAVVGVVGGYRQVAPASLHASGATVPILRQDQIVALFNQLEPTVALAHSPALYDTRRIRSSVLSYYERPIGTSQDQLIPIYTLDVAYQESGTTTTGLVYIPANPAYMAPLAQIASPTKLGATLTPGQSIVLNARDAAAKLSELGFDPSLNFALGSGKRESYTYTWYLNAIAPENKLGEGPTLVYKPPVAAPEREGIGSGTVPQTIVLEVRDTQATLSAGVSTASFQFNVMAPVFLPAVRR